MNIQEVRAKYPQYSDMSDEALASALHAKYYADMPKEQFAQKIGLAKPAPRPVIGEETTNPEANVLGMTVKGETDGGLNPAASIIGAGRLGQRIKEGSMQGMAALKLIRDRLNPWGDGGAAAMDELDAIKQSQAEQDKEFKKLEMVHPGSTQIGQIAPLVALGPKALIAAAGIESGSPQERALRVGAVLAGNKAATALGGAARGKVDALANAKTANAVRDANVASARAADYVALPSEVGGSTMGKIVEGATGKIKAGQLASVKNQPVTDRLVRKAFNLPDDAPLTLETMKAVRAKAFADGYQPVKEWGGGQIRIKPDPQFKTEIAGLTSRSDNAAQAFGDVVKSDIAGLVGGMKEAKPFTPSQGVDTIAILREKASEHFAKGDKTTARAYKDAATALEAQIERVLSKSGKDGAKMLKAYRDARVTMAKTFDAEKAINAGRDGMVNAQTLAKILKKSPDRLSGELRTVAEAGASMPQATRLPQQGWDSPVTAVDSWGGTIASFMSGNPLPFLLPGARVAGRYGMLTKPGQKAFTNPNYDPSLLLRGERALLDNQLAPQVGGLLGLYAANR